MNTVDRSVSTAPRYEIREVSETTGISIYTLRYYDKCGFFPALFKDKNGRRKFSDADIAHLHLVEALRKSGLSIEGIQYFVKLENAQASDGKALTQILDQQITRMEYRIDEIQSSLQVLKGAQAVMDGQVGNFAETTIKNRE